jgi:alkylated DNA repair dioxygenase AlkB
MENFLSKEKSYDLIFHIALNKFREEVIQMYGKEMVAPRKTISYGDSDTTYTYAGKKEVPIEWTDTMLEIRDMVYKKCQEFGDDQKPFNFVLVNRYKDENDYIGLHNDSESDIIEDSCIASISIGAARQFDFVETSTKKKTSLILRSGSLLLMLGKTQRFYKHGLPKSENVCGRRFNLTFRHLKSKDIVLEK